MAAGNEQRAVVCAVDGSAESHAAARLAAALAERFGHRLVLLSVAAPVTRPGVSAAPRGQQRLAEEEQRVANELLDALAAEIEHADASRRVEFGSPAACILSVAEDEDAAFVVLGSRGRGRMKTTLLGSVSRDVAGRARCPVVVVPG